MAKSVVRKKSRTNVSRKSTRTKISRKVSRKSRNKKSSRKLRSSRKRVSYRMMPTASGRDSGISVYDKAGNRTRYTVRRRDYTQMAQPYGLKYLRIYSGRPYFFDRYEDAVRAAFVPSAAGGPDPRVWIIQNDGTAFFVANE